MSLGKFLGYPKFQAKFLKNLSELWWNVIPNIVNFQSLAPQIKPDILNSNSPLKAMYFLMKGESKIQT